MTLLFADTHRDRTPTTVLYGGGASYVGDDDHLWTATREPNEIRWLERSGAATSAVVGLAAYVCGPSGCRLGGRKKQRGSRRRAELTGR